MEPIRVLYDGWPFVYQPNGPAALHLWALLAHLPPAVEPLLALPGEPPTWLPERLPVHIQSSEPTPRGALNWEQRTLPGLAAGLGARLLHLTRARPSLLPAVPTMVSPTLWPQPAEGKGLICRLREALARGGMARLAALAWPQDLPIPAGDLPLVTLPPIVHPDFSDQAVPDRGLPPDLDLPETFILYHGPSTPAVIRRLLNAWSWTAAPISSLYPLVMLGVDPAARPQLDTLLAQSRLEATVRVLPALPTDWIPAVYRRSSALFHPAEISPWGEPVRQALACGLPVVALESPQADALVGSAAYLLPGDQSRKLGAALITVVVEEPVAAKLAEAGLQRVRGWEMDRFGPQLARVYLDLLA